MSALTARLLAWLGAGHPAFALGPRFLAFNRLRLLAAFSGIAVAVLVMFMLMQPLAGWISDRTGRKPIVAVGFILGALAVVPLFHAIRDATGPAAAMALCAIPLVLLSGYTATSAILKAEFFPAHVRALGVALPYALAQALFGGTTEAMALQFKKSGFEDGFFYVIAGAQLLAFVTALLMRDSQKHSLIADD